MVSILTAWYRIQIGKIRISAGRGAGKGGVMDLCVRLCCGCLHPDVFFPRFRGLPEVVDPGRPPECHIPHKMNKMLATILR